MENKVWKKIDSQNLVYGGSFVETSSSIRALVFGVMVKLTKNRVEHYHSDLFYDAIWINENLTGPMQFDWIARENGTYIGEVCRHVKDGDDPNTARYRFDVREDGNNRWVLDIHQSVPLEEEDLGAKHRDDMQEEFLPYFSNEQLPESVLDILKPEQNQQKEELIEEMVPWVDRHAALDISDCDVAFTAAGCIFHPAPVNGWTIENPTLRNDLNTEQQAPIRKGMKMEDIIRDLREKFNEAESTKDQLEEFQESINDAVGDLENYLSDLDDLISSLDSLPEISIYVDLDTVSFDS